MIREAKNSHEKHSYFLSVVVLTYNHENFIRQCLDSILEQDTDFLFEILVGDDCSSDKTSEIIAEYQHRYPHIIKPVLRSENIGATKNQYDLFLKCSGKYIAILDGDDAWTHKEKLSIQTNFLEKNEDYIACTHRYSVIDKNNKVIQQTYDGKGRPASGDYLITDFLNYTYYGHPGTLVFKNIFLDAKHDYSIIYKADRWICDITLCLILTNLGKVYVLDNNMASYRSFQLKDHSNWTSSIAKKNIYLERIEFLKKLEEYSKSEMHIEIKHVDRTSFYVLWSIYFIIRYPSSHNWRTFKKIYKLSNSKDLITYITKQFFKLPIHILNLLNNKRT